MSNYEDAKERLKETFKEHPEYKKAFLESLEEMRKPENVETMCKQMSRVLAVLSEISKEVFINDKTFSCQKQIKPCIK